MKKCAILFLIIPLLVSCNANKKITTNSSSKTELDATAQVDASKQDGLLYKTAVFVTEKSELAELKWEYQWIKKHYSDYKVNRQSLVFNKKTYDIIEIEFTDGKNFLHTLICLTILASFK